jgi:hypothetical protein
MTDTRERARDLASAADHRSVTAEWLSGSGGHPSNSYLYDGPAIDHLGDEEQPHLLLYNERKGIGVDEKGSTVSPDPAGVTIAMVTDQRTLVLVGQEDGDQRIAIPHGTVTAAEFATGIMKHRITLEAADHTYHVWTHSGYEERDLRAAVELVGQFRSAADPASAGATGQTAASDGGAGFDETEFAPATDGPGGATGAPGAGDADDPMETLERLKELNEKGVLTDEEFAEKKTDLLDQI